MITINALKVRTKLGGILDNVSKKGEHYIIERMGKPLAVIAPYQNFDFKDQEAKKRQERIQKAIDSINYWREKNIKKYWTTDSAIIVRRMRDERSQHLLDVIEGRQ
ncbi:type II toxin-antitoxin system Phd/YefM family antitoxin [Candidatus Curtissbacteria bacterium]|nr:type II toxin-antitoxin system Phd/YefM family antitoxin [Candidatus Curtissbacteria bacterium]